MAVALGHTGGVDQAGTSNTSMSWSHDCTGDNTLLVVLSMRGNVTGVSVTYNSVSMTLVAGPLTCTAGQYAEQRVYQLDSPSSGSNTVSVSWTTGAAACGSSASFSGASTVGQVTQATGTFSYTKTVSSGDMIVGFLSFADAGANNGMSPAADKYNSANTNWTGTSINHNSSTGSQTVSSTYSAVYTVGTGVYITASASAPTVDALMFGHFA